MSSSSNCFRRADPVTTLAVADLDILLTGAAASPLRRSRICLHAADESLVQEMAICLLRDCYIRPHRHDGKSESYFLLAGKLTVVLFDDTGRLTQAIPLEPPGGDSNYYVRLNLRVWHAIVVDSEHALFHETTTGPYVPGATEFAPWAPIEGTAEAAQYLAALRSELQR